MIALAMFWKFLIIFLWHITMAIAKSSNIQDYYSTVVDTAGADMTKELVMQQQQQQQKPQLHPFNFANLRNLRKKYLKELQVESENKNGEYYNIDATHWFHPLSPTSSPLLSTVDGVKSATTGSFKSVGQRYYDESYDDFSLPMEFEEIFIDKKSFDYDGDDIQNVRRSPSTVNIKPKQRTFQSLCPTKHVTIQLDTAYFEYRPDHYTEVTCSHHGLMGPSIIERNENMICTEAGFECIQLNRTIHLTRKIRRSKCWQPETRIIPSGCECMWPKHDYGDIVIYHKPKRADPDDDCIEENY